MLKIAITGSTGLVGSRIIELLQNDFQFIPLLQEQGFDITNKKIVEEKLSEIDFDIFFHLAAYTNVDGAEKEKELVYAINVEGTRNVFEQTVSKGKQFIYISTDFVFDGIKPPYDEKSVPNPAGYYAQTKYEGEKVLKDKAMIIRISYPYRASFEPKKDFVRKIKSVLEEGKELKMMTDATITPTFIDDIAYACKYLFLHYSPEIYHVVGGNNLSPYRIGKLIAQTFGLNEDLIKPITYKKYSEGKAARAQYSEIISKKNTFYRMKTFEEGLQIISKIKYQNA
jgi:dTDP-4-dehydrorhamnose reductase